MGCPWVLYELTINSLCRSPEWGIETNCLLAIQLRSSVPQDKKRERKSKEESDARDGDLPMGLFLKHFLFVWPTQSLWKDPNAMKWPFWKSDICQNRATLKKWSFTSSSHWELFSPWTGERKQIILRLTFVCSCLTSEGKKLYLLISVAAERHAMRQSLQLYRQWSIDVMAEPWITKRVPQIIWKSKGLGSEALALQRNFWIPSVKLKGGSWALPWTLGDNEMCRQHGKAIEMFLIC